MHVKLYRIALQDAVLVESPVSNCVSRPCIAVGASVVL